MATLKTNKQIKKENPEYKIWLHKRLGNWVIDVIVNELKDEAEVYNGSNYQHTVGVFWFLLDRPLLMLELATEQIEHKLDTAARRGLPAATTTALLKSGQRGIMAENYNVILVEKDGKVIRASLALGVWADDEGQSTELHDSDVSAAEALLEYKANGAEVPAKSLAEARQILGR